MEDSMGLASATRRGLDGRLEDAGIKYALVADDFSASEKKREAAMLLSIVNSQFAEGQFDEARMTLTDALQAFKEVSDSVGLADCMRLDTSLRIQDANDQHANGYPKEKFRILEELQGEVREHGRRFRDRGESYGECCMTLSTAEVLIAMGGSTRRAEAEEYLLDALEISRNMGDKKLEASVCMERAVAQDLSHRFKPCLQSSTEATNLYRELGDLKNEAFALFGQGAAEINCGRLADGLQSKMRARQLWRKAGCKKRESQALVHLAHIFLEDKMDFDEGLACAEEANVIAEGSDDHQTQMMANRWIIKAHCLKRETNKAEELAQRCIEQATQPADKFQAYAWQMEVHICSKDLERALDMAEECNRIAQEEMPDGTKSRWYQAQAQVLLSTVYQQLARPGGMQGPQEHSARMGKGPMEYARSAADIMQDLEGYETEAFELTQRASRCAIMYNHGEGAVEALQQCRKIAAKADETYLQGMAMLGLGGAWAFNSNRKKSVEAFNLAMEHFQEEGYVRGQARVHYFNSRTDMEDCKLKQAKESCQAGIHMMEESGDNFQLTIMYDLRAEIELRAELFDDAADSAAKALRCARREDRQREVAKVLGRFIEANYLLVQEHLNGKGLHKNAKKIVDELLKKAQEGMRIGVDLKDGSVEMLFTWWQARLHLMLGRIPKSMAAAHNTLVLARESKEYEWAVEALIVKAECHRQENEVMAWSEMLKEAHAEAMEAGDRSMEERIRKIMDEDFELHASERARLTREEQMNLRIPPPARNSIEDVKEIITQVVRAAIKLGDCDAEELTDDAELTDVGLDSLSSIELVYKLRTEFGRVEIPPTLVNDCPTISKLANYVTNALEKRARQAWMMES